MQTDPARPVLYLKAGCPHCLKMRLFLLEAGLQDRVESREFTPGEESETAVRGELDGRMEKMSFPAARIGADDYMTESDAIVGRFAAMFGVDPQGLPVFTTYAGTVLPRSMATRRELMELKQSLA